MSEQKKLDAISRGIIGAAIDVHRELGPGLLEAAYEHCLAYELVERGHTVEKQKIVPIRYKATEVDAGFRIDLLVDRKVIVDFKAVDSLAPIHKAQLMTYLKLTGLKVGLLMNFNVNVLKHGLQRVVNNF